MKLITTHITLYQGLVDLDAEIAKCEKKIGLAQLNLEKVKKLISQPNYEQNIPEDVRAANLENVSFLVEGFLLASFDGALIQLQTYEAQVTTLEQSKASFEKLR